MAGGDNHLTAYLTDHLAGSVLAVDLLNQLESSHAGTQIARVLGALRADIESDRQELRQLMNALQIAESRVRQTLGLLTAKLTEIKLRVEDGVSGPLRLLESVETVALGIDGKLALWRSLEVAAETVPELGCLDYERLARRAKEQRRCAEEVRLIAARTALTRTAVKAGRGLQ